MASRDQVPHCLEFSVAEEAIAGLDHTGSLWVGDHCCAFGEVQDNDVAFTEPGVDDRLADEFESFGNVQVDHAVALAHGQTLADIQLREGDLVRHVIDDRAGHIEPGGGFDALEAR